MIMRDNIVISFLAHPTMPEFEVRQSRNLKLTSNSGLALIGLCCEAAQVDLVIDPRLPVSQGMKTSDLVKSLVGLLSLGKSDLEAIEVYRADRFFKEALCTRKCRAACGCGSGSTSRPMRFGN